MLATKRGSTTWQGSTCSHVVKTTFRSQRTHLAENKVVVKAPLPVPRSDRWYAGPFGPSNGCAGRTLTSALGVACFYTFSDDFCKRSNKATGETVSMLPRNANCN